jgi:hypothetical protein
MFCISAILLFLCACIALEPTKAKNAYMLLYTFLFIFAREILLKCGLISPIIYDPMKLFLPKFDRLHS